MSASKTAKDMGLPSLKTAADLINVTPETLHNYYNNEPVRFQVIILGCLAYLKQDKIKATININGNIYTLGNT